MIFEGPQPGSKSWCKSPQTAKMRVFTHQYDNCLKERNSTLPDFMNVVA
jgi:hypothetical protein